MGAVITPGDVRDQTHHRLAWLGRRADEVADDAQRRLEAVSRSWQLELRAMFAGGVGPPVLDVLAAGRPAVVKLGWEPGFDHQVAVLRAADGRGYVRVIDFDADNRVVLLERLGEPLPYIGLDPLAQCDVLVELLTCSWHHPAIAELHDAPPPDKAAGLRGIIDREAHHGSGYLPVLSAARTLTTSLNERGRHPVIVHGDPHPGNALHREAGWALIDPDGFRCDAAYDLGVVARGWTTEILVAGDAGGDWLRELCGHLAAATGVDAELIFDWAFVERVTTGLWLTKFGAPDGADYLDSAALLLPQLR